MNLISLVESKKKMSKEIFEKYKINKEISIKDYEVQSLEEMINNIESVSTNRNKLLKQFDKFLIGYNIKQIGKEFDLLRLGENYNINIELKSKFTSEEKIKKQLQKNTYYLKSLRKRNYIMTFLEKENKFVELVNGRLTDLNNEEVYELISKQQTGSIQNTNENMDLYFNPSKFLVSPFNLTDEFINGEYFLSAQQDEIKKELFEKYLNDKHLISIKGAAGTGKTLLTYDIANALLQDNENVLVIHCGILNEGHRKLINKGWKICNAKMMESNLNSNVSVIIIDEAQRMKKNQLEKVLEYATNKNIACLFSHDSEQCLHNNEINRELSKKIIDFSDVRYSLKEKVRTNAEMAEFIKCIFNIKLFKYDVNYNFNTNVEVEHFSNMNLAKEFVEVLRNDGWNFINYTNSLHSSDPFDDSVISHLEYNSHRVIGQEFEKVALILDQNFYYKEGRLNGTTSSYYNSAKMLFQILTRTKNKLYLIVVNNENVLQNILFLLNGHKKEGSLIGEKV